MRLMDLTYFHVPSQGSITFGEACQIAQERGWIGSQDEETEQIFPPTGWYMHKGIIYENLGAEVCVEFTQWKG